MGAPEPRKDAKEGKEETQEVDSSRKGLSGPFLLFFSFLLSMSGAVEKLEQIWVR